MTRVATFGTGSWGTVVASLMREVGAEVTMWGRRAEAVEQINRSVNEDYLPGIELPEGMGATTDPHEAAAGADIVVLAVPSQTLRENLKQWGDAIPTDAAVVSLMKGIELGTGLRMSQVIHEAAGVETERIAVLSGPNLAREVMAHQPAATMVACPDHGTAEQVAAAVAAPYFRPYTSTDIIGAEIAGSVKNVIALAVGMAEGMGMGDNSKASIITRGLAEMTRLGVAVGGDRVTFSGLAGVGDLIATCMSPLSRNHTFGVNLGRGMSVEEVVAITKQTAEGVKSCASIVQLAHDNDVQVPIAEQMLEVIQNGLHPSVVVDRLLSRPRKTETA